MFRKTPWSFVRAVLAFAAILSRDGSGQYLPMQMPMAVRTPAIGGVQVYCNNARGMPVMTVFNVGLGDAGMADPVRGLIILNPRVFGNWPTGMQLFMYGHECAHHLGFDESGADCWSVRTGVAQGWFTPADLRGLAFVMQNNPGDWTHMPGPRRIENMFRCATR